MKKIIIGFTAIFLIITSIFVYNYNQKQSNLRVVNASNYELLIKNTMNWKEDVNKYLKYNDESYLCLFDTTISNIYSANLLLKHGVGDKYSVILLNKYYKEIAEYLGVSTDRLDELNQIGSDKRTIELTKILNGKRNI